jgi:hypothetical protein
MLSTMSETTAYIPGVCNINREEIARRRRIGHVGASVFVVLLLISVVLNTNRYVRIILLVPAMLAASGYLQARGHFCVGYAAAGQQNASEHSKTASPITDQSALAADKRRARKMNLQAFAFALVVTLLGVGLPR